jgi:HEAT repeat protein
MNGPLYAARFFLNLLYLTRIKLTDSTEPAMPFQTLAKYLAVPLLFAYGLAHAAEAGSPHDRAVYQAVQVARAMMSSQDIYDRILAAGALSDIGDSKALETIARALIVDDNVVQRSAIDTLITANHPNSVDLLFKSASASPAILGMMAESLASVPRSDMGELLAKALEHENDFVKRHALQALVRAPGSGESAAIEKLEENTQTSPIIKAYAEYALLAEGQKSRAKDMMAAAKSTNADIREVSAVALGLIDSKESRAALGTLSKDSDQRVALAAVASDAGLGNQDASGKIIQVIAYGTPMESTVLAGAMKRLPGKTALQITQTLMSCCKLKGDAATRLLESWAFINADATAVYRWGLSHQEADVRMQTIWMVGHRKDAAAISLLVPFLGDEDPGIRGMAAWAIIHTKGDSYVEGVET